MPSNNSPLMTPPILTSSSMASSSGTDTTSRSSTSPDILSTNLGKNGISINSNPNDLPWILHRILECQLSCELPLHLMFAYNSGQKLPSLKQAHQWWQYGEQGKLIIQFLTAQEKITPSLDDTAIENLKNPPCGPRESINPDHHPKDRFMDQGNDLLLDIDFASIGNGRRQSEGLPPSFVQKICLNNIFAEEYEEADFTQALHGLDYIRDIEVTRRAALREAAQRLDITKENWREVLAEDPDAKQWVENMQGLEVDISTYYATIFIDLRIWTMINELQSEHFYKPNVLAMLNTLFPPCVKELPNDKIDKSVLHKHRAHFYQYVLAVEKQGRGVLKHFVDQLLKPGTKHSWPETRKNLELYFERADNMIKASTAIHGIRFFRDSAYTASNYSASTPSLSERPSTGESGNTMYNSHRSHKSQTSVSVSIPRSEARTSDKSQSRRMVPARRKISTSVDQNTHTKPLKSFEPPWVSSEAFHCSGSSTQSLQRVTTNMGTTSGSFTHAVETGSLRTVTRSASGQTTPLTEQGSEAAQHDSFLRPITPFEEKRREIIDRRETISAQSAARKELNNMFYNTPELGNYLNPRPSVGSSASFNTPEMGSYFNPRLDLDSCKTTIRSVQTPLPSDNFEFLKRPYDHAPPRPLPSAPSTKSLKKKSSIGNFFLRKKLSMSSIATVRGNFDSQTAFGIEMAPTAPLALRPTKSTEAFPRFSQDAPSIRPTLRKQFSDNDLQKSITRATMQSFQTRTASGIIQSGLSEIIEDDQFKRMLKTKASLPNLRSKRFYEKANDGSGGEDHFFIRTGDDYERYTHVVIPRPATSRAQAPEKKEIRKARSFASLRSWATKDTQETIKPRKTSRFRREPQEGETISSRMISEPFPMKFQYDIASLARESRDKEYTRRWFIEEARARRYGLNKPDGEPLHDENDEVETKKTSGRGILKKMQKEEKERPPPFEMPRATPKVPQRPNRQRWDSIFPRRALPPKSKPTTHTPIDLGKYAKIPGKVII